MSHTNVDTTKDNSKRESSNEHHNTDPPLPNLSPRLQPQETHPQQQPQQQQQPQNDTASAQAQVLGFEEREKIESMLAASELEFGQTLAIIDSLVEEVTGVSYPDSISDDSNEGAEAQEETLPDPDQPPQQQQQQQQQTADSDQQQDHARSGQEGAEDTEKDETRLQKQRDRAKKPKIQKQGRLQSRKRRTSVTLGHLGDTDDESAQDGAAGLSPGEAVLVFKQEHEKLMRILKRTVSSAGAEFSALKTLHKCYVENMSAARVLAEANAGDENVICSLKSQIKHLGEVLAQALSREEKLREELAPARESVAKLAALIASGVSLSPAQERTVAALMESKETALNEYEAEGAAVTVLQNRLSERLASLQALGLSRQALDVAIAALRDSCAARRSETDAAMRRKQTLDAELAQVRQTVNQLHADYLAHSDAIQRNNEDISVIQGKIKQLRQSQAKTSQSVAATLSETEALRAELRTHQAAARIAANETSTRRGELEARQNNAAKLGETLEKSELAVQAIKQKMRMLASRRAETEHQQQKYQEENLVNSEKHNALLDDIETLRATLDDLARERAILQRKQSRVSIDMASASSTLNVLALTKKNLEQELLQTKRQIAEHRRRVDQLREATAARETEARAIYEQARQTQSTLRKFEDDIYKHKREVIDIQNRVKYNQNLYDAALAERNVQMRNLIAKQNETSEQKRQLKIIAFQISGLKEETVSHEAEITHLQAEHERLEKDTKALEIEISTLEAQFQESLEYHRTQGVSETRLAQHVKDAEQERHKQTHLLAVSVAERDRISEQLVKQQGQLRAAYESIKSVQYQISCGEKHYAERLRTIRDLEKQVRSALNALRVSELETRDHDALRHGVHQLRAEKLAAMCQTKALSDGLAHPINIHRWRRLNGSKNTALATLQLAQALQRTLVAKHSESAARDMEMQKVEAAALELRKLQTRQVGPEVLEQISELEIVLGERKRALERKELELKLLHASNRESRYTLASMDREISEMKLKYFACRRERDHAYVTKQDQSAEVSHWMARAQEYFSTNQKDHQVNAGEAKENQEGGLSVGTSVAGSSAPSSRISSAQSNATSTQSGMLAIAVPSDGKTNEQRG